MDMTRDFVEKIEEMSGPHYFSHNGYQYADKALRPLPCGPNAKTPLETGTLSSVSEYINNGMDGDMLQGRYLIHVKGPRTCNLYTEMDADKRRDFLVSAQVDESAFPFGRFLDVETFIIQLQANFVQDESTAKLLAFVSSIRQDSGVTQEDNGVTQSVTASSGVSLSKKAAVPNPVTLRPYRTFSEVEQPASSFVFRVHADNSGVTLALFTADGQSWMNEAIANIRKFFQGAISDPFKDNVVILA